MPSYYDDSLNEATHRSIYMPLSTEQANAMLPQEPTLSIIDPVKMKYFIIGPPKFGKTTMSCAIPNSLLLAFEEGHAFVSTHKIIIDSWDRPYVEKAAGIGKDDDGNLHMSLAEAVVAIVASDRFDHIIIDTADMAAKMCVDYHCAQGKVKHPSELGEYGKGYDLALAAPFRQMFSLIIKSGRGITFTSHTKLVTKKVGKEEVSKWESTLPSQAQTFIHSQADVILYGKFGKHRVGQEQRDRIFCTDGSEIMMAGTRVQVDDNDWPIPKNFIADPRGSWKQWASFLPEPRLVNTLEGGVAQDGWLRTPEEAIENCHRAADEYDVYVLGRKAVERDKVVADASGTEVPQPDETSQPEAPTEQPILEPDSEQSSRPPETGETTSPETTLPTTVKRLARKVPKGD